MLHRNGSRGRGPHGHRPPLGVGDVGGIGYGARRLQPSLEMAPDQEMADARLAARMYTREHGEDDPAIAGWRWSPTDPTAPGLT